MGRKYRLAGSLLALCLASCSPRSERPQEASAADGAASSRPGTTPHIAFRYDFSLRVADAKVRAQQNREADRCEAMGPERCRVIALEFATDDHGAGASLGVAVARGEARAFGNVAVAATEKDGGRLVSANFSGDDAGAVADEGTAAATRALERLAAIERDVARVDLPAAERAQLRAEAERLRGTKIEAAETARAARARIAMSPITLRWDGEGHAAGFVANPVKQAWLGFVASAVALIEGGLWLLAVLLPWLAAGALLWWLWRRPAFRRFRRSLRRPDADAA